MSSLFDSMIPSRRREQKRLRDEATHPHLHDRWGNLDISAPNEGGWFATEPAPELEWASPLSQGFASPDAAGTLVQNSPDLGEHGEQVIIVDADADPTAQTYHEDLDKNSLTFTIPLPWPSRKTHSRSPSVSQTTVPTVENLKRASPRPSAPSAVVYKATSDQYMKELGDLSRGNSPVQSLVSSVHHASPPQSLVSSVRHASPPQSLVSSGRHASPPQSMVSSARRASPTPAFELPYRNTSPVSSFARRSPSPPVEQAEGHNISAIMLLSPVVEDFPSRSAPSSTFSRASSQRKITPFTRQVPSPPLERPSTATSRSETGTSVSRATAVTDVSFHTAITHHTTRSSSRGPGLAHTATMRSASREPASRRAMSREPTERRAMSREPTERRAMSREPSHRRAMSREPTERRTMSREPSRHRAVSREPSERRAMSREPTERRAMSREPSHRREMSREPTERRAMSREPSRRREMFREPARHRAMTQESASHRRPSFEELRYGASSTSGRTSIESDSSQEHSLSEVGRNASNSSATGRGYYTSMADEYRHIAWETSNAQASDSDSLVGRVGKVIKEKAMSKDPAPALLKQELVPGGQDLYS